MNETLIPDVSVIIGAYEAMPYLTRCLQSVEAQTLPADRFELIAVDDGSKDGTGAYLDEFAARTDIPTTVIHQANSGGPSGPRNVGLARARGRFVFFLDADDFLGFEALERMVALADKAGTDVVLGKMVGVNRGAAGSMWGRHDEERVDLYSSRVIYTLSAQKLFRRDLLVRHGITFDETMSTGEDSLFTMEAYLRGAGVSVVSEYVCYYLVGRDDGLHVTRSGGYEPRFAALKAMVELIAGLVPAGPERDYLMARPFTVGLIQQFGPAILKESEEVRAHKLELAAPITAYWTPGVAKLIKVNERLRLECVARGRLDLLADVHRYLAARHTPKVVRADRGDAAYLAYPHFRKPEAGLPDEVFEMTVPEWSTSKRLQAPPRPKPGQGKPAPTLAHRVVRRVRRDMRRWKSSV
ncbi:glycosyltransferase [Streptomyces sp. NBC_01218]|uniref:glycosyltransferase family 2 protein n=1 Tax=Streptomyces sp. NBC_01218 TaxID=2903780 RepID=UPI002E13DFF3|nr:glycosyltransferase [Streptomyces sp. NBC_01218]